MNTAVTRSEYSEATPTLYLALELSLAQWKLAFTVGLGQKPRLRTIPGGDMPRLFEEIGKARKRFGLPEDSRVLSCYEAGRESFWVYRCLRHQGVENRVVDSASIERSRRRQAKTDRLDAIKLVGMLVRFDHGEKKVWSVVRVPTEQQEDARHLERELQTLSKERTQRINRIKGLLATQGLKLSSLSQLDDQLAEVLRWDGSGLPPGFRARVLGEWQRLQRTEHDIGQLKAERQEQIREAATSEMAKARRLQQLRSVGPAGASRLAREVFWRTFSNRKQIGSLAGLTPTPFHSGQIRHDQGISKAGSGALRGLLVEMAWGWVRWQPQSELSRWFERRFAKGPKRLRRIGIVAVARRLLIALWRFVEFDIVPQGAILKKTS